MGGETVDWSRRDVLRWIGALGVGTLVSPMAWAADRLRPRPAFVPQIRLVQLTDLHIGFHHRGFPDPEASLEAALAQIQSLKPDLVVVTGDLIQASRDAATRATRMARAWAMLSGLRVSVLAIPGEQDALLDRGRLFAQQIGPLTFHHVVGGVHLVGLDNVSRGFFLGHDQLAWLQRTLQDIPATAPVLVLAHAPLARYYPPWNWYTFDGAAAAELLAPFPRKLLLHGHVHHLLADDVAGLPGLAARPTSFVYPAHTPSTLTPLAPEAPPLEQPDAGLGIRWLQFAGDFHIEDRPLRAAAGMHA